jgi:hypothetical protein
VFLLVAVFLVLLAVRLVGTLQDPPSAPAMSPAPISDGPSPARPPATDSVAVAVSRPDPDSLSPVPPFAKADATDPGAVAAGRYAVAINTFRWDEPSNVRVARVRAVTAGTEQRLATRSAEDARARDSAARHRTVSTARLIGTDIARNGPSSKLIVVRVLVTLTSSGTTTTTPAAYAVTVGRTSAGWRVVRAEGASRGLTQAALEGR